MAIPQGGRHDITIHQGAPFAVTFQAREDDETTVIPLTGYTGRAQARGIDVARSLLLDFDVDIDEDAGEVTVSASAVDTAELERGGVYDVEIVQGAEIVPFVGGKVTLERQVTEP